jgi:hypothetical protein
VLKFFFNYFFVFLALDTKWIILSSNVFFFIVKSDLAELYGLAGVVPIF